MILGVQPRCRTPELTRGAPGEAVFVHPDLPADQVEARAELADLRGHAFSVLAQQSQPFALVAGSSPDELGIAADRGERHAGGAEAGADIQPLQVLLVVDAVPVEVALHRVGEDALPLVETQRVNAQTCAFGDLSDAQTRFDLSQSIVPGMCL